jgi:hypothetical protein
LEFEIDVKVGPVAMAFDFANEIVDAISRVHFGFWLRDPLRREHSVPGKLLIVLLFLIVAIMTILDRGTSAVASAIYAIYFLAALFLSVLLVFLRQGRVRRNQVSVIIEAYVVALFITVLLLSHNLFFPIAYFSIDTGVDRSTKSQLLISYGYVFPAIIYIGTQSYHLASLRVRAVGRFMRDRINATRLRKMASRVRFEIVAWSVFHFLIIGFLIWMALFGKREHLELLEGALKEIKLY